MNCFRLVLVLTLFAAVDLCALEPPRVITVSTAAVPAGLAVDPARGVVYTADSDGLVIAIDEITRRATHFVISVNPVELAVDTLSGTVYVLGGPTPFAIYDPPVTSLDPTSGASMMNSVLQPGSIAVNSTAHRVYVTRPYNVLHSGFGSYSLTVLDGLTLADHDVRITAARSTAVGVDELHDRVYAATGSDFSYSPSPVAVIDGTTEQTADVELGCQSIDVVVDAARSRAWFRCVATRSVYLVEGDPLAHTGRVIDFPIDGEPAHLAVNPTTGRLYVALQGRAVIAEIDADGRRIEEISIAEPAKKLAVNPVTNVIYAVLGSASKVTLVDGKSHEVVAMPVGEGASDIVVDVARDIAWIATSTGLTGLYGPTAPCLHCTRVVERP